MKTVCTAAIIPYYQRTAQIYLRIEKNLQQTILPASREADVFRVPGVCMVQLGLQFTKAEIGNLIQVIFLYSMRIANKMLAAVTAALAWRCEMYPRIRDLREDKDMNQTTFAELVLDMSQTGYSKFETGENDISTEALIRMALYHETSLDYLVGLTDQKAPYPASRNRQERMLKYREDIRKKLEKKP